MFYPVYSIDILRRDSICACYIYFLNIMVSAVSVCTHDFHPNPPQKLTMYLLTLKRLGHFFQNVILISNVVQH